MKRIIAVVLAVLALASCGAPYSGEPIASGNDGIGYVHDDAHRVSCWTTYHGISCLPDSQVQR